MSILDLSYLLFIDLIPPNIKSSLLLLKQPFLFSFFITKKEMIY